MPPQVRTYNQHVTTAQTFNITCFWAIPRSFATTKGISTLISFPLGT